MKLILFFFFSSFCFSQNHIIIDSSSKNPIPYANIKFIKEDKGFYSNNLGNFKLNDFSKANDSIQISCLGYSTFTCKVDNLSDTIFLKPKIEKLDEIIIHSNQPTVKKIGFKKGNINFHTSSSLQFGLLIKPIQNYKNTLIHNILIPIKKSVIGKKKRDFNSILKVSLFSNKNDYPYESLLDTPKIINCNQDSENIISIDISKEYITFNNSGIFILIEVVGEIDAKENVISKKIPLPGIRFTNKLSKDFSFSKSFYKPKHSNEWKVLERTKFHLEKDIYLALQLLLATYDK